MLVGVSFSLDPTSSARHTSAELATSIARAQEGEGGEFGTYSHVEVSTAVISREGPTLAEPNEEEIELAHDRVLRTFQGGLVTSPFGRWLVLVI